MPPEERPSPAATTDVRAVLRRRYPVVLLGALAGVALGLLVSASLQGPPPTASVGLEVLPTGVDLSQSSTRGATALDIDRAAVRVTSQAVLTAAVERFGSPLDVDELEEQLDAEQLNDAPLLELTVTADSGTAAVSAADAVAAAYLDVTGAEAQEARAARTDELQAQLDETYGELSGIGLQIGQETAAGSDDDEETTVDTARVESLEAQREALLRRAAELERTLLEVRAQNIDPGRVARAATLVEPGRLLGRQVAVPAVAALGLLLGLAAALLVDRSDRRLWEPEQVTAATGTGNVVRTSADDLTGDGLRDGGGHRRLRTLVAPRQVTSGSVLVTGTSPEHGAAVAAGLAVAVAASGRRVILVDAADQDAFDVPAGDLDGWLGGRVGLDRAARTPTGADALQVLHGRPSSELGASATLRELLAGPTGIIVLHVPGGSESGDVLGLTELVDRIAIVAAARRDTADELARTYRWLARDAAAEPVVVLAG